MIQQTTQALMTQLQTVGKLETVKKTLTKTIEGEQQLAVLTPHIEVNDIIGSALFKDKMVLDVQWDITAGYDLTHITTWDINVSRDGTVTLVLGEPSVFWITLTGATLSSKLGIVTQKDIDLETALRNTAGEMMIQEALSGNILQEAKSNAQNALQTLFLNAGIQIKEVIIKGTGGLE